MKGPIIKAWKIVSRLPNVNGISGELQPRIRRGVLIPETKVIRVYVTHKVPETQLLARDVVPKVIAEHATDVVPIGEIKPLASREAKVQAMDRTMRYRPALTGVSLGHYQVTASTLGWFAWIYRGKRQTGGQSSANN